MLLHSLLLLGSFLACAAAQASAPPRTLHYRFDLHDPTHIRVELELNTPRSTPELLLLPSEWAGETELYRAISGLHLTTPNATLTQGPDPTRLLLQTRRRGPVTLTYNLAQDWSGPLRPPLEHRAILGPTLFEFNGANALVTPTLTGTTPVDVTFDLIGLPPGQALVTSFGTAPHQHFRGPWSAVRNALFAGGVLDIQSIAVDAHPVLIALHGPWSFHPGELASGVRSILLTERHLWNDTAIPFYAIVIAPYESNSSGGAGSGFTDIFNLFLPAGTDTFTTDIASLLAHEAFHQWNPGGLGAVRDTAEIAWFGEGFTRFYQDTTLEQAGIIGHEEYLARLNTTIRDYRLSPNINLRNADLIHLGTSSHLAGRFANPLSEQQPYLRGAIIALWLSSEIDRQTSGRQTLTDLMLALRAGRAEPLTADRIFETAGRFVDPPTVDRLRSFALDGATVPVPAQSLGSCVALRNHPAWTFDLGFDTASLRPAGIVEGVRPGSSASRAGVHDGQQVGGFTFWNGNPDREVTLTLRETDGRRERLSFFPRGQLLSIPQAEPIPGCPAASPHPQ